MSWFKRTKNPQVGNDYLQTTDTVSRPLATLFTFIIIFVVGALAFSLFFGGRWLYEHLDGSDQPKVTVVENPITAMPPSATTSGGNSTSQTTPSTPSTSSATATSNPSANTSNSSTTGTSGQVSATATAIPATGPTDMVAVFVATFVVASFAHYIYLRRSVRS